MLFLTSIRLKTFFSSPSRTYNVQNSVVLIYLFYLRKAKKKPFALPALSQVSVSILLPTSLLSLICMVRIVKKKYFEKPKAVDS